VTRAAVQPAPGATRVSDNAEAFLAEAARREPTLRAFTSIDAERLRREAVALDELPVQERGPLFGSLIAVKEVFDVAGYVCGWGSPIHANRIPDKDAAVVEALRAAGALIAGITVSTEYAMAATGPTTNPHDPLHTPGASSQGSGAAVGAGLVPAALGSQTIGSIVRPAAYCGIVGFKPTWGLIDDRGAMPLSQPIDHPGFVATDPDIAERILGVLAPRYTPSALPKKAVILRPWYEEATAEHITDQINIAAEKLRQSGVEVTEASIPDGIADFEAEVLDTILSVGMAKNIGDDYDTASDRMSPRIRDYVIRGRNCSSAEYDRALACQHSYARMLDDLLHGAVALAPATVDIAPLLSDGTGSRAPQRLWTLAGLPAASVPFGSHAGMPIGIQVIGPRQRDADVMAAVRTLCPAT